MYFSPMQDYVSVWQIINALEVNRIVPIFVIQYDGRGTDSVETRDTLLNTYEAFIEVLPTIPAQVRAFDTFSDRTMVTQDLINIIEGAYNVSFAVRTMLHILLVLTKECCSLCSHALFVCLLHLLYNSP